MQLRVGAWDLHKVATAAALPVWTDLQQSKCVRSNTALASRSCTLVVLGSSSTPMRAQAPDTAYVQVLAMHPRKIPR